MNEEIQLALEKGEKDAIFHDFTTRNASIIIIGDTDRM